LQDILVDSLQEHRPAPCSEADISLPLSPPPSRWPVRTRRRSLVRETSPSRSPPSFKCARDAKCARALRRRRSCWVRAIAESVSKETSYSVKRDLLQCQKKPITVSKETYYSVKRDLLQCQKRPITVSKETYYRSCCVRAFAESVQFDNSKAQGCAG